MNDLNYLDEKSFGKPIRQHVKEFGALFGLIALLFIGYAMYKSLALYLVAIGAVAAVFFIGSGYLFPAVLHPAWKAWMGMAHYMGIVMTTLILSIAWIIVVIPVAVLLKVVKKKVMDLTYDPAIESYWNDRADKYHDFKLLENQF